MQQRQRIVDLENKLAMLSTENSRFASLLDEKRSETENLKYRLSILETNKFNNVESLRSQLDSVKQDNLDLSERLLKKESEYIHLEGIIVQQRQQIENLQNEVDTAYEMLNARKKDSELHLRQNEEMRREILNLKNEVLLLERDIQERESRIQNLTLEMDNMVLVRESYRTHLDKNIQDISRKNRDITDKIEEIDSLKYRLGSNY
eukprot:TRINITY_DN7424_c0_g3_i2.p1 TRINITY_DN7424_c0_g3~~TRINITY_DN7424_c0_g3_i2.p1  ORF type:complete len:205 (+),score=73.86 TRINITY_DN7424_c0_g3_i2:627-1241(+)